MEVVRNVNANRTKCGSSMIGMTWDVFGGTRNRSVLLTLYGSVRVCRGLAKIRIVVVRSLVLCLYRIERPLGVLFSRWRNGNNG